MSTPLSTQGRFERLLFRPVPLWVTLLVALLGLAFAILFGAFLLYALNGGKALGWLQKPALAVASSPLVLQSLPKAAESDPFLAAPGAPALPAGLARGGFSDPGFLLVPLFDPKEKRPLVRLIRLSDGRTLREWRPDAARLQAVAEKHQGPATPAKGVPYWLGHPDLLDDGSIVFKGSNLLVRADVCGAVRWARHGYHHSVERGPEGEIWTGSIAPRPDREGTNPHYRSEGIARLGLDGRLTYSKSLTEIFAQNGLEALVRGREYGDDPYHLNDVEPVFADGPHWKKGDVFLSLAHQSMVLQFRPATDKVVWWRIGPWMGQHDVNLLDERRISLFDNRISFDSGKPRVLGHSRQLVVDLASGSVSSPWEAAFRRHAIAADSNGRGLVLANGDLVVEESNRGEVLRVTKEGETRWRYVNSDGKGRRYRIFWSRYLDPGRYAAGLRAAAAARCA